MGRRTIVRDALSSPANDYKAIIHSVFPHRREALFFGLELRMLRNENSIKINIK